MYQMKDNMVEEFSNMHTYHVKDKIFLILQNLILLTTIILRNIHTEKEIVL